MSCYCFVGASSKAQEGVCEKTEMADIVELRHELPLSTIKTSGEMIWL